MVRKCFPIMGILLWIGAAEAGPWTRANCANDYFRYCVKVSLDDRRALTACMSRNAKRLSSECVDALIKDGYVTRKEAERRRR